jgi:putative PEP-CTERM system TPR-repeat lipoprotein
VKKKSISRAALGILLSAGLLSGCSKGDPDAMLASAKSYLTKNDQKAAVIQLKNALQLKPDSGEVRFLLGKTLLESGDAVAASVELRKALDLKYAEAKTVPLLARTLNAQGQQELLLSQFAAKALDDPQAMADLKTSVAGAYIAQGKKPQAEAALTAAFAAVSDYLPGKLLLVRLKTSQNEHRAAVELLDGVLAKHPESTEAWQLKGDFLQFAKADPSQAIEAYKKSAELKASNVAAHSGLLSIYIAQRDFKSAATQFEVLKKALPAHPQTKYFEAVLAYEKQDFKQARELVLQLLKAVPDNAKVLQLAGLLELQSNALLQAEIYLNKALQAAPDQAMSRRLLAQTYLRMGQAPKAIATLQALVDKPETATAETLALAGEAQLQAGDSKKAESYFQQAAKLDPADARSRTALALSQIGKGGNAEAAFSELQTVAAADKGITADMALISARMRRGEFDAAIKATDALERKQPDKPLAAELRGRLYLAKKNAPLARQHFERALKIDPLYFSAAANLATMDLADKKPEQAKKRFDDVLAIDPKNVRALLALAELRVKAGAVKDEITGLLNNAIKLNPTEPTPRLLLVEHQMRGKDFKLALATVQDAATALPDSPEVLEAQGQVQQAAGEVNRAITSFSKLTTMRPQSTAAYMHLAGAQAAQNDSDGAVQSLKRALAVKPDFLPAQRSLIQIDMAAGRTKEAKATVRTIQSQRPGDAVGLVFEADIEASLKNWDSAAAAYKAALDKGAGTEAASKLHGVLMAAAKPKDADKLAASWIKEHPQDAAFIYYLGDQALGQGNFAVAESHYQAVKRIKPDNAAALNNIAWVLAKQKKTGALGYAEQANKLQPDQAPFLDTMAMILSDENQLQKALETQKKALALQPQNNGFRLNLARIYLKNGQKTQAKIELEQLAKLGEKFRGQEEVGQLLKAL